MDLTEYHKKRNFQKSPEPKGKTKKITDAPIYVIQKHAARRLHYDFRLEIDGVLKSWAVPKEPPTVPGIKRLAVQVEDHPIDYASFEGVIPEGQYGAGTVEIWDSGSFEPIEVEENKIVISINGNRLKGEFCLVRTRFQGNDKNWLFFKRK
jgi:DNA ligase D-like protein (predicted 3'-phosphoesterase)